MNPDSATAPPRIRPGWVWGIFVLYVSTAAWSIIAWVQIYMGTFPLPAQQVAILRTQTPASLAIGATLTALNLVAAVWLWLLRKRAFELFVGAFVLGTANTVWNLLNDGPLSKLAAQNMLTLAVTLVGLFIGSGLSLAICLYVWTLRQRGVLQ